MLYSCTDMATMGVKGFNSSIDFDLVHREVSDSRLTVPTVM